MAVCFFVASSHARAKLHLPHAEDWPSQILGVRSTKVVLNAMHAASVRRLLDAEIHPNVYPFAYGA